MIATYQFDTTGFTQEQVNLIPAALGNMLFNDLGVPYDDIFIDDAQGIYTVQNATSEPAITATQIQDKIVAMFPTL